MIVFGWKIIKSPIGELKVTNRVVEKLILGRMKMILENKRSVLQKYNGSQKLSQIGKSRLFR
ncbi:hypothetical protein, partial [Leptospira alexanderi]|uniref:hypothetical protein n=1 Tax=Leptospira alexanderi TaxID=100053 RepID=UPI000990DDFD